MSHVVIQAAEFPTIELAKRCETELQSLIDECVRAERAGENPTDAQRVFPPLASFGNRHGIAWPKDERSRFSIKGMLSDELKLLQVDRMVFLWAAGFELGGDTFRKALEKLGASSAVGEGDCHLVIRNDDPDTRIEGLAEFLNEDDMADQYELVRDAPASVGDAYFSITVAGPNKTNRLVFDDSGVQDWAFTALLPQLSDEDPAFLR